MSSVEELCEEITLINRSKAVLQGKVAQIRQDYKKHIFKVQVADESFNPESDIYTLIESKRIEQGTQAIIKINDSLTNNDVIRKLAETYNLIMFEEMLPSMQEVFIETVKETTYNQQ
jgi:ABC-type uncharacterized transport system, ATPase component